MHSLEDGLAGYLQKGLRSFHTPGHKGREEFYREWDFQAFDLTELPGLDMLHSAQGIIAQAQQRAAEIFGADESYFLINGATVGNQAMLLTLDPGRKPILVGRASHRSLMSGLVLSGLEPKYLAAIIHPEFNLPLGLDVLELRKLWGGVGACHLTYPTYYGTAIDLAQLMEEGTAERPPLLVDQAHGAHYLNKLFPPSSLALGADLVVHSMHKTLSALTQTGLLHVQGSKISRNRLRQSLEMLQSSSPNYQLMASLERANEYALETSRWEALREEVELLYYHLGDKLRILSRQDVGTYGIQAIDWSKILVNTRSLGITASQAVRHLRQGFGIEPELWDEENILFFLGIGSTPEDVRCLTKGLNSLTKLKPGGKLPKQRVIAIPEIPPLRMTPREAFLAPKRQVKLRESLGCIVGETISPYPPGIPLIVSGEELTSAVLDALANTGVERWQGWDGFENGLIWIIEEW